MAEIDLDDVHPAVEEILSEWSEKLGRTEEEIAQLLEIQYELDVTDIEESDAQRFKDAYDAGDAETMADVLESAGVSEEHVEQFKSEIKAMKAGDGDDPSGNGQTPEDSPDAGSSPSGGSSGGSGGLSESEVRQVATEAAAQATRETLEEFVAQQGGGGGGQAQGQAQGGSDPFQSIIAQAISQSFLGAGGGGGQAAKIGEMFEKKAMQQAMGKLFAPDPFDMMRMQQAKKMADKMSDDPEMKEMMEDYYGFPGMDPEEMGLEEPDDDEEEGNGFWGAFSP